jgi:hypothetical protein
MPETPADGPDWYPGPPGSHPEAGQAAEAIQIHRRPAAGDEQQDNTEEGK